MPVGQLALSLSRPKLSATRPTFFTSRPSLCVSRPRLCARRCAMCWRRPAMRALRAVIRLLQIKVLTPVLFTVVVSLIFFVVFVPSLLHPNHHHQDAHSRYVAPVHSGLFPASLLVARQHTHHHHDNGKRDGVTLNSSLVTSPDGRFFLTVMPRGRLGNQMFQYASLLGLADVNNRVPFVTSSCKVTHYFANTSVSDRVVTSWVTVEEERYAARDVGLNSLPQENVRVKGFMQSWRYFAAIQPRVRQAFTLLPDVQQVVTAFLRNQTAHLPRDVIKVGVHVRRTDMVHRLEKRQGYLPATLTYLQRAMRHMTSRFGPSVHFFLVSDDPEWCQQHLVNNTTLPQLSSVQNVAPRGLNPGQDKDISVPSTSSRGSNQGLDRNTPVQKTTVRGSSAGRDRNISSRNTTLWRLRADFSSERYAHNTLTWHIAGSDSDSGSQTLLTADSARDSNNDSDSDNYSDSDSDLQTSLTVDSARHNNTHTTSKAYHRMDPTSYRHHVTNVRRVTLVDPAPSTQKHHVINDRQVTLVDPAPSIVHMGFLASCDHVIMTVGTFGWWAAYLSGGHVTYYDGYPRPGSEVAEGFDRNDFYLPDWVPLGD
ncbi:uncharacterized protein [Littorina saxatilis]|uniref:L-Fucosyltransferase n=1 Tax=Littorina saxatilis TaxID=31220 RepID=A0AAN9AY91_9CAEN